MLPKLEVHPSPRRQNAKDGFLIELDAEAIAKNPLGITARTPIFPLH